MKRLIVILALFAAACTGGSTIDPAAPSASTSQSAALPVPGVSANESTIEPTPGGPGNTATTPRYSLAGPTSPQNCFTAGTDAMQWVLNMTDAGPSALRFVALAHQDDTPGCEATAKNPRTRIATSGVSNYTPHSLGTTTFTFDQKLYNCGRVQVDISIFDAAGNETLILGTVINYGTQCAPPRPALVCTPGSQVVTTGLPASFTASGGTGTYAWASPSGSPVSGSGTNYQTTYAAPGVYTVTLTSGGQSTTCSVQADAPIITPTLQCAPGTQTGTLGSPVTLNAVTTGTVSGILTWTAVGATTATGTGTTFSTSYAAPGTYSVTVSNGTLTSSPCTITIPVPPTLACTPPSQTATVGSPVTFQTVGTAPGPYTWTATGGNTPTANGTTFTTAYATPGTYSVTVTNGVITSQPCTVNVPVPTLVCTPPTQTAQIGQTAAFSASGGTGTYTWSAPGASTTSGGGANFSTTYAAAGTYIATVTSGSQTANCAVNVPPPAPRCDGVTATIVDLLPPTVDVQVNIPAGQRANMIVMVRELPQDILLTYTQLVTQTGQIHVPGGCFVQVSVYCGAPTLTSQLDTRQGPNTCAQ